MKEPICRHCGGLISIRMPVPVSKCDHLYYPESCGICMNQPNETKHTTTPWNAVDKLIVGPSATQIIGGVNSREDATYIVKCVNAHDEDQKKIKGLVKACENAIESLQQFNTLHFTENVAPDIKMCREAIALAKRK